MKIKCNDIIESLSQHDYKEFKYKTYSNIKQEYLIIGIAIEKLCET